MTVADLELASRALRRRRVIGVLGIAEVILGIVLEMALGLLRRLRVAVFVDAAVLCRRAAPLQAEPGSRLAREE